MSYSLFMGDRGQKARLSTTYSLLRKKVEPLIYMTVRVGSEREKEQDDSRWRSCHRCREHLLHLLPVPRVASY